jgi:hypothetical protein
LLGSGDMNLDHFLSRRVHVLGLLGSVDTLAYGRVSLHDIRLVRKRPFHHRVIRRDESTTCDTVTANFRPPTTLEDWYWSLSSAS